MIICVLILKQILHKKKVIFIDIAEANTSHDAMIYGRENIETVERRPQKTKKTYNFKVN